MASSAADAACSCCHKAISCSFTFIMWAPTVRLTCLPTAGPIRPSQRSEETCQNLGDNCLGSGQLIGVVVLLSDRYLTRRANFSLRREFGSLSLSNRTALGVIHVFTNFTRFMIGQTSTGRNQSADNDIFLQTT